MIEKTAKHNEAVSERVRSEKKVQKAHPNMCRVRQ